MIRITTTVTSLLICVTTALFGFVAAHHPAHQTVPPALVVNGAQVGTGHFSWHCPNHGSLGMHGSGPNSPSRDDNRLTVAPGAAIRLRSDPFWFGTRQIGLSIFEAEDWFRWIGHLEGELQDSTTPSPVPVSFTAFGSLVAPEISGQYVATLHIIYESYIPEITGQGWANYMFLFTVE